MTHASDGPQRLDSSPTAGPQAAQSAPRQPAEGPEKVRLRHTLAEPELVHLPGADTLRRCAGHPPLARAKPELAAQWHPSRNGALGPEGVTLGSGRKVWWLCKDGQCGHDHAWRATVAHRTQCGSGCPICSGHKPCTCNSLAALHPDLVSRDWDTEVNTVRPEDLLPQSNKAVHWRCSLHEPPHLWAATPNDRVGHQTGCPLCPKHRPPSLCRASRSQHPQQAK